MLLHTGESNTMSIEDDASRHGINIRILLQKQKGLGIPGDDASRDGMQSSSAAATGRGGRARLLVARAAVLSARSSVAASYGGGRVHHTQLRSVLCGEGLKNCNAQAAV